MNGNSFFVMLLGVPMSTWLWWNKVVLASLMVSNDNGHTLACMLEHVVVHLLNVAGGEFNDGLERMVVIAKVSCGGDFRIRTLHGA